MTQTTELPLLDRIQIATPCKADWNKMSGNETVRACGQCKLNVYNVSEMTRESAEAFLQSKIAHGERTCVRLYRRSDGTILSQDCPVGLRRMRLAIVQSLSATIVFLFGGLAVAASGSKLGEWATRKTHQVPVTMGIIAVQGKLAPPAPPPSSATSTPIAIVPKTSSSQQ